MNKSGDTSFTVRLIFRSMWIGAIFIAILCSIGDRVFPQHGTLILALPVIAGALFGTAIAISYASVLRARYKRDTAAMCKHSNKHRILKNAFLADFKGQGSTQLQAFIKVAKADDPNMVVTYNFDAALAEACENSIEALLGRAQLLEIDDQQVRESSMPSRRPTLAIA